MDYQKQLHERRPAHEMCVHKAKETLRYVRSEEIGPNNQLVTKQLQVTTHPSEELDKYQVSDFCMSNMQKIGADLHPCKATSDNRFAVMDKANEMLGALDKVEIQEPQKQEK